MEPFKSDDAWMRPDGGGMMFCREADGFIPALLECDLDLAGRDWNVTEIRLIDPANSRRKVALTGQNRESAMDFIIDNLFGEIDAFVAEHRRGADDDYDARCDTMREHEVVA
jgi:hypothetical protein